MLFHIRLHPFTSLIDVCANFYFFFNVRSLNLSKLKPLVSPFVSVILNYSQALILPNIRIQIHFVVHCFEHTSLVCFYQHARSYYILTTHFLSHRNARLFLVLLKATALSLHAHATMLIPFCREQEL